MRCELGGRDGVEHIAHERLDGLGAVDDVEIERGRALVEVRRAREDVRVLAREVVIDKLREVRVGAGIAVLSKADFGGGSFAGSIIAFASEIRSSSLGWVVVFGTMLMNTPATISAAAAPCERTGVAAGVSSAVDGAGGAAWAIMMSDTQVAPIARFRLHGAAVPTSAGSCERRSSYGH